MNRSEVEIQSFQLDYMTDYVVGFHSIKNTHYYIPRDMVGYYSHLKSSRCHAASASELKCLDQITWLIYEISEISRIGRLDLVVKKAELINKHYKRLRLMLSKRSQQQ